MCSILFIEIEAEARAIKGVAEVLCPLKIVLDRVVLTSTGVLLGCWQVLSGSDPTVVRAKLRNALPRAPEMQLYDPVLLHTSFARLLGHPKVQIKEMKKPFDLLRFFNELVAQVNEPARQNNGKARILGDATRLVQDLIQQVESLKKENAALVTESHYVDVEKNELKDDNTVLGAEIERLRNELHERMHSNPVWHDGAEVAPPAPPQPTAAALPMQQPSVGPLYVIPLHQELHPFSEVGSTPAPPKHPSHVMRPHARYPTPSDSWPLGLLSRHQRAAHEAQHKGSSSSMTSNSREGGTDEV
ncbi:Transcription factor bHLH47 [Cocos nucifera]|uniref:Transcription factor bHLH47 n=1 Tax=Cocos nucifera TaxID=13894 RepID=A0A8K0NB71_COCNU|nr:Transcription factor bHLH47 [Cocos nucifera]